MGLSQSEGTNLYTYAWNVSQQNISVYITRPALPQNVNMMLGFIQKSLRNLHMLAR